MRLQQSRLTFSQSRNEKEGNEKKEIVEHKCLIFDDHKSDVSFKAKKKLMK